MCHKCEHAGALDELISDLHAAEETLQRFSAWASQKTLDKINARIESYKETYHFLMEGTMKFPKELLIYVFDKDEKGEPIFGIANNADEIPDENSGEKVAVYTLNRTTLFKIKRELEG
mgnify:CR=1 FL=1